jgi:hypothetical protein
MPAAAKPTEEDLSQYEEDMAYRGRGRPRLPPEMKRREKLVIALTKKELQDMIRAAVDADGGPLRLQDWARRVLFAAAEAKKESSP